MRCSRSLTLLTCILTLAAVRVAASSPRISWLDTGAKHTTAVSIKGMAFNPEKVEIKAGDTVVWTNDDDRDHSVVAKDGSFKSDKLGSADTFEFKFKTPGKYPYGCSYHPRMKGVIIVSQSSAN